MSHCKGCSPTYWIMLIPGRGLYIASASSWSRILALIFTVGAELSLLYPAQTVRYSRLSRLFNKTTTYTAVSSNEDIDLQYHT